MERIMVVAIASRDFDHGFVLSVSEVVALFYRLSLH